MKNRGLPQCVSAGYPPVVHKYYFLGYQGTADCIIKSILAPDERNLS